MGKADSEGGLNEYFGENWGWIGFSSAITRGRPRNKSAASCCAGRKFGAEGEIICQPVG